MTDMSTCVRTLKGTTLILDQKDNKILNGVFVV